MTKIKIGLLDSEAFDSSTVFHLGLLRGLRFINPDEVRAGRYFSGETVASHLMNYSFMGILQYF